MKIGRRSVARLQYAVLVTMLILPSSQFLAMTWIDNSQYKSNDMKPSRDDSILMKSNDTKQIREIHSLFPNIIALEEASFPKWMKDYFVWHNQTLQALVKSHEQNQKQTQTPPKQPQPQPRLLIARCLQKDQCGGLADRLRMLPYYLALAAKTKRLFFFYWTRPFSLADFLQPASAVNWTLPDFLEESIFSSRRDNKKRLYYSIDKLERDILRQNATAPWLVQVAVQSHKYESAFHSLAQTLGSPSDMELFHHRAYHDLFWYLFQPVPPLRNLLEYTLTSLDLTPNRFIMAHYRANYPGEAFRKSGGNSKVLQQTTYNAIHCALVAKNKNHNASSFTSTTNNNNHHPVVPVYFASDRIDALYVARNYSRTDKNTTVTATTTTDARVLSHLDIPRGHAEIVGLPHDSHNPPHWNFAKNPHPSTLYPVVLDLLVFSLSSCASYGSGGYGQFGSMYSYNASCRLLHTYRRQVKKCDY